MAVRGAEEEERVRRKSRRGKGFFEADTRR